MVNDTEPRSVRFPKFLLKMAKIQWSSNRGKFNRICVAAVRAALKMPEDDEIIKLEEAIQETFVTQSVLQNQLKIAKKKKNEKKKRLRDHGKVTQF